MNSPTQAKKISDRAIRAATKVAALDSLATQVRNEAARFITRELDPTEFVKSLHDLAYKCQSVLKEPRVRLIDADKVRYQATPIMDPSRIGTDRAIEFIKLHNITLPNPGYWRLLADFNAAGEIKFGLRALGVHGIRTLTNGIDLCVLRDDGSLFWGIMDNWIFDPVVRKGGNGRVSRIAKETQEAHDIFV